MLIFSTPTHFDLRILTLMGASAKIGTNPIGQFGTGLKYSIAQVLAHGGQIKILQPGGLVTEFTTADLEIRGQTFSTIHMSTSQTTEGLDDSVPLDSIPLGITTALGAHWEPWMIFRELWSNTQDEGGTTHLVPDGCEPKFDPFATHIIITGWQDLELASRNRSQFLLHAWGQRPVLWSDPTIEVYEGNSDAVFYRGIKVLELPRYANMTYNILAPQTLTEDRTLSEFNAAWVVVHALAKCHDPDVLAGVLGILPAEPRENLPESVDDSNWESTIEWTYAGTPSEEFLRATQKIQVLNHRAKHLTSHYYSTEFLPEPLAATPAQIEALNKVTSFFTEADMVIGAEIHLAVLQPGKDHQILDGAIYLNPEVFETNRKIFLALMTAYTAITKTSMLDIIHQVMETKTGILLDLDEVVQTTSFADDVLPF